MSQLDAAVSELRITGWRDVALDLRDVSFLDSGHSHGCFQPTVLAPSARWEWHGEVVLGFARAVLRRPLRCAPFDDADDQPARRDWEMATIRPLSIVASSKYTGERRRRET